MIDSGQFKSTIDGSGEADRDLLATDSLQTDRSVASIAASDDVSQSTLFDLGQIDVRWDADLSTLWAFMTPHDRPNYNLKLLRDIQTWQTETKRLSDAGTLPVKYMVLGSRFPGVFNLGGDLEHFAASIEGGDLDALVRYGHACIDVVYRAWCNADAPVISVALAQGDALGGGFEALLCFDVVVAERSARFGLPEMLFGLFPGMGAYSILSRKLGRTMAERMLLSGKVYSAEEMHDMGIVTLLVEDGEGEAGVRDYINRTKRHHAGYMGVFDAGRRVDPLHYDELKDIVENWAKTALKLDPRDIKLMRRLASAQTRLTR